MTTTDENLKEGVAAFLGEDFSPSASPEQGQQQSQNEPVQQAQGDDNGGDDNSDNEQVNPDLAVSQKQDPEEEEIIVDDEDENTGVNPESPFANAKDLLGFEVKSLEDIKTVFEAKNKEFEEQLKQYKEAQVNFANDDLKELNDFVAKGGKIAEFKDATLEVAQLDNQIASLKTVNPVDAYKQYLINDLELSTEEAEEYIEQQGNLQATMEGKKLLKSWEQHLAAQKQEKVGAIEAKKQKQQQEYQALVEGLTKKFDEITSISGVSVTASEKARLKQLAQTPLKVINKYFMDDKGQYDLNKFAKTVAMLELGEKKAERLKTLAKSQGQRQVVEGRANLPIQKDPRSNAASQVPAYLSAVEQFLNS